MGHIEGRSRFQSELMGPSLDELLEADHEVRVIDAFVDSLDLRGLGFARVDAAETGRPAYAPDHLLKLYVYGYMNQVRSSRRLEREARRNIEMHWLIDRVRPSFKTIADFRRDHADAIVQTCGAFVRFCNAQATENGTKTLIDGKTVVIDGTKVQAAASRKKLMTTEGLEKQREAVETKIKAHLQSMDETDAREEREDAPLDVAAALEALRAAKDRIEARAEELKAEGLSQKVRGEPEAQLMKTPRQGMQVAYNVQSGVDPKHKLVVALDVTSEGNDHCQLLPMADKIKRELGVDTLTVVADVGYSNGKQASKCAKLSITPIVPRPAIVNPKGKDLFTREAFTYEAETDSYRCPAGRTLHRFKFDKNRNSIEYRSRDCSGCELKPGCTKAERRSVMRDLDEEARQAMHERATPEFMTLRRATVEHPFGTMKAMMGHPRFLLRGIRKVRAEWALTVIGYNLKRVRTILGTRNMITALNAAA